MATLAKSNYVRPLDSDEFEDMARDICALEWGDPDTKRYGRSGQTQYGVDIFGKVSTSSKYRAVQCKLRSTDKALSNKDITDEVDASRAWPSHMGELEQLIIATDHPYDTHVQKYVTTLNDREIKYRNMKVSVWFWKDIWERLITQPRLLLKYYHDHIRQFTNVETAMRLVNTPITVNLPFGVDTDMSTRLRLRGLRTVKNADEVDGVVIDASSETKNQNIITYVFSYINRPQTGCPIVIVTAKKNFQEITDGLAEFPRDSSRIYFIDSTQSFDVLTDNVFSRIFDHGYSRRGKLTTIEILARNYPSQSKSSLLDLDWEPMFSDGQFPSTDEWEEYFIPAQKCIIRSLSGVTDDSRIQIDSRLKLPAAFSLGFHFNTRNSNMAVWNRARGQANFKKSYWLSTGERVEMDFPVEEMAGNNEGRSATLELSLRNSIHADVEAFLSDSQITVSRFISCRVFLTEDGEIDGALARSFADFVGSLVRKMKGKYGISDFHVFLNMPSALGILLGRNFQSCGRLHLYWYDNPTYRYAFTLK